MKICFTLMIILILLSGCKDESLMPDTIMWSDDGSKKDYSFDFKQSDLAPVIEIHRIKIYDSLLIIAGRIKENDCLIHFFNRNNLKLIKSIASTGRGPEEYSRLPLEILINNNSNEISITDISFRITRIYNIDSLINGSRVKAIRELRYSDQFGPILKEYSNGSMICDPPFRGKLESPKEPPDLLSLIDLKTQTKLKSIKYPTKDNFGLDFAHSRNFNYAFMNDISVSPDGEKILIAYKFMDLIEIYDKNLSLVHRMHGPDHFTPQFEQTGDGLNIKPLDNNRYAFDLPIAGNDEFWVHYSGEYEKERKPLNRIFVFNWDGKLKSVYRADEIPAILDIDFVQKEAYGVSIQGSLIIMKF